LHVYAVDAVAKIEGAPNKRLRSAGEL
jgi:hypothetical protein